MDIKVSLSGVPQGAHLLPVFLLLVENCHVKKNYVHIYSYIMQSPAGVCVNLNKINYVPVKNKKVNETFIISSSTSVMNDAGEIKSGSAKQFFKMSCVM
jgi:hypothetical protein